MKRKLVTVDAETLLSTPMSKTMFIVDELIPRGERLKRSRQDRQNLANAVAGASGDAGDSCLGNPDHAMRCAVSLSGGYTKANQRPAVRFDQ